MFKFIRIAILLLILATVAEEAWLSRSRAVSWKNSLQVAVYPINGDGSEATASYLRGLGPDAFKNIERYFDDEAKRHGRNIFRPVEITMAPVLNAVPPQPARGASALGNVFWSLQMRYWAWRHDSVPGIKPQIRLFVLFFDPATHPSVAHSVGVERGMIGLINAFGSRAMAGSNAVIVTHELLHTLGATDKYDPGGNMPRFPDGYAEPERLPRYPQALAEIMAGRIPISETKAEIPENLDSTLIGAATAAEIGWAAK